MKLLRIVGLALFAGVLILAGAVVGVMVAGGDDSDDSETTAGSGYLGISVARAAGGLRVAEVDDEGPADEAGIATGDILRFVDGNAVQTEAELESALADKSPGEDTDLTLERNDQELRITVKLAERPSTASSGQPGASATPRYEQKTGRLGVQVAPITPDLKQRLNLSRDTGVVVIEVQANSPASMAGLQRGDIIRTVGETEINANVIALQRALSQIREGEPVVISVLRGDQTVNISVTLNTPQPTPSPTPDPAGSTPGGGALQRAIEAGLLSPELIEQMIENAYPPSIEDRVVHGYLDSSSSDQIVVSRYSDGSEVTLKIDAETAFRSPGQPPTRLAVDEVRLGARVLAFIRDDGEFASVVLVLE